MDYTETLSITLPAALAGIAAAIGRAFDPDLGGAKSFSPDGDGLTISMRTPCTPEFRAQADYLMANPNAMHKVILADYEARWPNFEPPTLDDCVAFCAAILEVA